MKQPQITFTLKDKKTKDAWKEALKKNGASQSGVLRNFVEEFIRKSNK